MSASQPNRQVRTHTCFSYCKTGNDKDFLGDDRKDCIKIQKPEDRDKIICLYPEPTETCEITSVHNQVYLGDPQNDVVIAPYQGLIAILIANPLQILWDFMCVTMMKWKVQKSNPGEVCKFLTCQLIVLIIFCLMIGLVIYENVYIFENGDNKIVLLTFALTFIID